MNKKKTWTWVSAIMVGLMLCSFAWSPSVWAGDEADVEGSSVSAWPMLMHDAQQTGRSDYRGPSSAVKLKWDNRVVSWADGISLVVGSDGEIYSIGSDGHVNIIDAKYGNSTDSAAVFSAVTPIILKDGRLVSTNGDLSLYALERSGLYDWKYDFDEEDMDIQSPPTIGPDEVIYLHGSEGKLIAFDSATGKEKWQTEVYGSTMPALSKTKVLYTVSSGKWPESGYIYAVAPADGHIIWKLQLSAKGISACKLAVADDGTIYAAVIGSESALYAVTAQGTLKWTRTFSSTITAPALAKTGEIYIGSSDGILHAVKPDGSSVWDQKLSKSITTAPIIDADGIIYACADNSINGLNPADGTVYWTYKDKQTITSPPVIDSRGILYYSAGNKVAALYSTAPFRPYNLTASADKLNNVTLTWNQAAGKDEHSFVIEQRVDGEEYKEVGTVTTDVTTFRMTGVPAGTYTYRVKAVNGGGDSPYSNEATLQIAAGTGDQGVRTARFYLGRTTYYQNESALTMDVAPVVIEGRTFLPLRYVADALGAEVQWVGEENKVIIVRGSQTVTLWINDPVATVNGQSTFIDPTNHKVQPTLLPPGRTMLPIRFIAESLDCQVDWNNDLKEVKIVYVK